MSWDIDINCDLGEGAGNDTEIMPLIQSCSIASGGHYGTSESIRTTINLAKKHSVKIGAHPSYPDPENFGRTVINMEADSLKNSLIEQVLNVKKIAIEEGVTMRYVKLHGALYNMAAKDPTIARTVVAAFLKVGNNFNIYTPNGSELQIAAEKYFNVIPEVFIDRRYQKDGSLTPRSIEGALIQDITQAWNQVKSIYKAQSVQTLTNELIPMTGKTYCLHGDSEHCLTLLQHIHQQLKSV